MRIPFLPCLAVFLCLLAPHRDAAAQATPETITIDARTPAKPFPHFLGTDVRLRTGGAQHAGKLP
jgi:hypothetical protein